MLQGMEESAPKLFEAYGLRPVRYLPPKKGYRNTNLAAELPDGRMVNLILYKCEPDTEKLIKRTNAVGNFVASQGLPARKTFDKRILCLTHSSDIIKRYAALYDYLPGETIPWEAYTQNHVKALGMALSRIHSALKEYPPESLPKVHEQYTGQLHRMAAYFEQLGVRRAMADKLHLRTPIVAFDTLLPVLRQCARLPAQQALHMDFVRGNILFRSPQAKTASGVKDSGPSIGNAHISGILDFEKAAFGHPLFDIARTLAFLLVDCKYKTEGQVRQYFLYSGYAKRGPRALPVVQFTLGDGRIDVLERLVDLFLLHDLYKFLRHNPYESLDANEHYQRTRNLCLRRGLAIRL